MSFEYEHLPVLEEFNNPQLSDKLLIVSESLPKKADKFFSSHLLDTTAANHHDNNDEGLGLVCHKNVESLGKTTKKNEIETLSCQVPEKRARVDAALQEEQVTNPTGVASIDADNVSTENSAKQDETVNNYFVHSFLLALHSDYFRALFATSGMKETNEKEIQIMISDGESLYFKELLEAMYSPDSLKSLPISHIVRILGLADRYCCDLVIGKCLDQLTKTKIKSVNDLNMRHLAVIPFIRQGKFQEGVKKFRGKCTEWLLDMFTQLEVKLSYSYYQKSFMQLNIFALKELLTAKDLEVQSENSVLSCILIWAAVHSPSTSVLERLLKHIDIHSLTSNYLCDIVTSKNEVLHDVPSFKDWFIKAISYHSFSSCRKAVIPSLERRRIVDHNRFMTFRTTLGRKNDDSLDEDCTHFDTNGSTFLCNGYWIGYTISICNDEGTVFFMLEVPQLEKDDEIFFEADYHFSLHCKSAKQAPLLTVKKHVVYSGLWESRDSDFIGNILPENYQATITYPLYGKLKIFIH